MANKDLKIVGFTISISFLMFLVLGLWLKAVGFLIDGWMKANALVMFIILSVLILIGAITGTISLRAMTSKGKGLFS